MYAFRKSVSMRYVKCNGLQTYFRVLRFGYCGPSNLNQSYSYGLAVGLSLL